MISLDLKTIHPKPIKAGHIGTVSDVIAGVIPNAFIHQQFNASDFQFGFEMASPNGMLSLGESVLVNGYCYTCSTNINSPTYLQTIAGKKFTTSGIFLIPLKAKPNQTLNQIIQPSVMLTEIYDALYTAIQRPFAFAGFFDFAPLHATAIAKPPIHQQNIFKHSKTYYPNPEQHLPKASTFMVGAMADYTNHNNEPLLKELEVVLYRNPFEQSHTITTHAHGMTLKKTITTPQDITPDVVDKTFHIFSNQSFVTHLNIAIFWIESMENMDL